MGVSKIHDDLQDYNGELDELFQEELNLQTIIEKMDTWEIFHEEIDLIVGRKALVQLPVEQDVTSCQELLISTRERLDNILSSYEFDLKTKAWEQETELNQLKDLSGVMDIQDRLASKSSPK